MKTLTLLFILLSTNAYAGCVFQPLKPGGFCSGGWVMICQNHRNIWVCSEGF